VKGMESRYPFEKKRKISYRASLNATSILNLKPQCHYKMLKWLVYVDIKRLSCVFFIM